MTSQIFFRYDSLFNTRFFYNVRFHTNAAVAMKVNCRCLESQTVLLYNHCDYYQLSTSFFRLWTGCPSSTYKVGTTVPPGKQSSRNVVTPPYTRHTCNYSQWTAWCNWQLWWCRQNSFYYLGTIAAGKLANLKIFQVSARLFSQVPEQYGEQVRNCFLEVHSLTNAQLKLTNLQFQYRRREELV